MRGKARRPGGSLLAAHDPPDQKQQQRQYAAGFDEKNPALVQVLAPSGLTANDSSRWAARAGVIAATTIAALIAISPTTAAGAGADREADPTGPGTAAGQVGQPLPVAELPGWQRDDLDGLADALARQCAMRRPPKPWPALCAERPADTAPENLRAWIETRFEAWPLTNRDGSATGLITGYHEPLLTGSRQRESPGQVALYQPPPDLRSDGARRYRIVDGQRQPYPARAALEASGLLDGHELVWLDDPIEAFFLQTQGSGRVHLRDGTTLRVGFANHNGQAYRAIGAELVARGALRRDEVNAPAIKAWLRTHPEQAPAVMASNPRFIFFRRLPTPADAGPPGSLGVPLTPMRSVATDPGFVPPGALLFLETRYPDDGRQLAHAVLSQDRGAAIVGSVRADLFFGSDANAETLAGRMQAPGRLWWLRPRPAPEPARY